MNVRIEPAFYTVVSVANEIADLWSFVANSTDICHDVKILLKHAFIKVA